MTWIPSILSLVAGAFAIASVVVCRRTVRLAKKQVADLKRALDTEVRLSTQLREMLAAIGVETIVEPTAGDYALSFKAHFPPPNITHALRAWRGPVRH